MASVHAEIVPKGPHPRTEPVGGEPGQGKTAETVQGGRALLLGQDLPGDETPKDVGNFAVDEVGNGKLLVSETIGVKIVRNEFDDDAGIDDSQSPRPSCNTVRIVSRSTWPRTFACVALTTAAFACTASRALGQVLQLAQHVSGQGKTLGLGRISQCIVDVVGHVSNLDHSGHGLQASTSVGADCTHGRASPARRASDAPPPAHRASTSTAATLQDHHRVDRLWHLR